jgi:hypothetical protein
VKLIRSVGKGYEMHGEQYEDAKKEDAKKEEV